MAETASNNENDSFTDLPVGEILRRTREHYDRSLEDIEHVLNIRSAQLKAIEDNDTEAMPARVYAIGFVRSYSEHLGLDGDKMVNLFKAQGGSKAAEPELHFPVVAADNQVPPWWIIVSCIIAVIVILSLWFGESSEERKIVETIPPVPKEMQTAVAPKPAPTPVAEPETIKEKPAKGIILNIRENSWVEIRDKKGKAMISQVLKAGDQYYVPDRPDLTISIGNAGGVEIEVDGVKLRKLGKRGSVLRRLSLDASYLKKNFALEKPE